MATKNNSALKNPSDERPKSARITRWVYPLGVIFGIAAVGAGYEIQTSTLQSNLFHSAATGEKFTAEKTGSAASSPAVGPYDDRLGYVYSDTFRQRLLDRGYTVSDPKKWLDRTMLGIQLFPIYNEKSQAGLKITDDTNQTVYLSRFPRKSFDTYEDIPQLLVQSLLFVENRELGADNPATWNPAIDWGRMARAIMGQASKKIGLPADRSGASTLATQIEKFRHSPDGMTATPAEKLRQMMTASVRAYQDGENTEAARHRIVLDYLNSVPLSSYPKFGEVIGFGDGLTLWFGEDFDATARLMNKPENELNDAELHQLARTYRASLSLVMAVKKPSAYLLKDREELQQRVDAFLPLLAQAGIISPRLRDLALAEKVIYADPTRITVRTTAERSKAVDSLRIELMTALNVNGGLYGLDRLDLSAHTTIDGNANAAVTKILRSLTDPAVATERGLVGYQLLKPDAAPDVVYTFTLYEKTAEGNVLRVQTDNYNGPLNLNEGGKLELGSTAKLRTLVSYMEAMAELHKKYAGQDSETLLAIKTDPQDNLTRWAVQYLANAENDTTLNGMLEAALERRYSSHAGEMFFTGGGLHRFNNFDGKTFGGNPTVKESFHNSVNLPFIRMMRDLVYYSMSQKMNIDPEIYENPDHPVRKEYLTRFVHDEGTGFMWKFWNQQKGKTAEDVAAQLAEKTRRTPLQLAVLYRSMFPEQPYEKMEEFIRKECATNCDKDDFLKLYDAHAPGKFNLNDRGYLTRIHPLALWMASYRMANPDASWDQTVTAAADTRIETYKWLLESNKVVAQNKRIRIMLEQEAFTHIHKTWKNLGYPFQTMVPSYASSIGSAGDTPAALSELTSILQNDGVRRAPMKFRSIEFGANTPYEMEFHPKEDAGTLVLSPEVAHLVRREMGNVVEQGTARRAHKAVTLSDGRILPVGGKTGTGDNRMQTVTAGGGVIASNAKSRTATFVFAIDDRFYGTVTAYVMGPNAGQHKFTSALATQVFKNVVPAFRPVLDRAYGVDPATVIQVEQAVKPKKPSAPAIKPT